ncbi:protein THEM6-like [Toxorhynchites rutilus septentrionalis]|uniref:protein THEM6-like n=1 Tax=Toxorhynchites rutilus septentrionalis TaxID=329112 RepID=UPI00247A0CFD|nr:protein THEM6-like [Toxorhynchites rutilus septentrionalis]XP_055639036.1 protein THEM6-like [Toxorhynchites rutilus septentrionalis]XP_055639045.1 protein THEM6-like [Toxorhynchites rutilus septentrionalis]XP_055639051.1 protein THEM6-like [Toxorhynchites rutilus septentrionalis]XP_055639059.1 protein THEM6-like [Toxorhynchites rutilus septentrionalis]
MWWMILAMLYIAFDFNYFIRVAFTIATVACSNRNLKMTDTITTYGLCTTQDIDMFIDHMNNARFLRELDFTRFHWYGRTAFWSAIKPLGGSAVQSSAMIRYRKKLPLFRPFRIETRLAWWDDKSLYFEHKFVTLFDDFVRAIAFSKQGVTGCDVRLAEIMDGFEECRDKPEQLEELRLWSQANEVSSQKLRKER